MEDPTVPEEDYQAVKSAAEQMCVAIAARPAALRDTPASLLSISVLKPITEMGCPSTGGLRLAELLMNLAPHMLRDGTKPPTAGWTPAYSAVGIQCVHRLVQITVRSALRAACPLICRRDAAPAVWCAGGSMRAVRGVHRCRWRPSTVLCCAVQQWHEDGVECLTRDMLCLLAMRLTGQLAGLARGGAAAVALLAELLQKLEEHHEVNWLDFILQEVLQVWPPARLRRPQSRPHLAQPPTPKADAFLHRGRPVVHLGAADV